MKEELTAIRTCHICGTETAEECPVCARTWENRPKPEDCTDVEKLRQFDWIISSATPLEIDFEKIHERVEELLGRPVWTHEFADPERLRKELTEKPAYIDPFVGIPPEKRVLIRSGK
jgi:hypothetical protein